MSEDCEAIKNKVHKIMDYLDIDIVPFTTIKVDIKTNNGFWGLGDPKNEVIKEKHHNFFIRGKKTDKILWYDHELSELSIRPEDWQVLDYGKVYPELKKLLKEKMDQENFDQYCEKALGFKP